MTVELGELIKQAREKVDEENYQELFGDFEEAQIAPLESIEPWVSPANNFDRFFIDRDPLDYEPRGNPVFRRFQLLFPELEEKVTKLVTEGVKRMETTYDPDELPWEILKEAYEIMSHLVGINDLTLGGKMNERYLIG